MLEELAEGLAGETQASIEEAAKVPVVGTTRGGIDEGGAMDEVGSIQFENDVAKGDIKNGDCIEFNGIVAEGQFGTLPRPP